MATPTSDSMSPSPRILASSSSCSRFTLIPASSWPSDVSQRRKPKDSVKELKGRQTSVLSFSCSSFTRPHLKTYPSKHSIPQRRSSCFAMSSANPFLPHHKRPKPFQSIGNALHLHGPASPSSAPLLVKTPLVSPSTHIPPQHQHPLTLCWLFPSTRAQKYEKVERSNKSRRLWRRVLLKSEEPKVMMAKEDTSGDTASVRRYDVHSPQFGDQSSKCCGWKLFGVRKEAI